MTEETIWSKPLEVSPDVKEAITKDIWKTVSNDKLEDVKLGLEMCKGILGFEDWLHLKDRIFNSLVSGQDEWLKDVRYHDPE